MSDREARHVVLGAGAMGIATAYHLALRGEPVLLIEQFALGHERGSSHGAARITRHSYADPTCARLMPLAFEAWRALEADAGRPLYLRTGGVSVCPPEVDYVARVTANLAAMTIPHRRMTGRDLNRAMPAFGVPENLDVVFEPDAGMLAASRVLQAELALARRYGGDRTEVLEHCQVTALDLDGPRPVLHTTHGRVTAERLIVTAGPWIGRLIPGFSRTLQITRQQVLYFSVPDSRACAYGVGSLPVFIAMGADPLDAFYGMPPHGGLGLKVARHGGPITDPDFPDPVVDESYRLLIRDFLRRCLPEIAAQPIERTEICLYTMIPGEQFRIGPLPGHANVVVASPCSGHGFKFSGLIGRVLADLATQGTTNAPIQPWLLEPPSPGVL